MDGPPPVGARPLEAASWILVELKPSSSPCKFLPESIGLPLTLCARDRGTCPLVSDSCLTPRTGDRGSGHQASHHKDRVHRSVSLNANHQAPGTDDLGVRSKSHAKTILTGSGLLALVKDKADLFNSGPQRQV